MHADDVSLHSLIGSENAADPAFVFDGRPISRAKFSGKVEQTAAWLAAQGIGKGDVVAVWLVNRIEWIALLFAAARLGAIVAAVNTRYRGAEVAHLLKLSGAKLLVVEAAFRSIDFAAILADIARDEVPALQELAVVGADAIPAQWPCARFDAFDKPYPPAPTQDDVDLPVLLYTTSGTTKGPKLGRTLAANARDPRQLRCRGAPTLLAASLAAGLAAVLWHLWHDQPARLHRSGRDRPRARRLRGGIGAENSRRT